MFSFGFSDYFLTPSKNSLKDYQIHFRVNPKKAFIIPNGVSIPPVDLEKLTQERLSSFDKPKLLWVGRISLEKRIDFIFRAFKLFADEIDSTLTMVGDGSYREIFEKYALELGISDKIKWEGFKEDPSYFFLESHVFVHGCLSEEFGYTLAEAISFGLPVVSYNCPHGPLEILDGGKYGFLVRSEEEMAETLKELLTDKSLWKEFSRRAFQRAKDFDIVKISEEYVKLFKRFLR